jgi:hypothetical protein
MFRGSDSNHQLKLGPVRTLAGLARKADTLQRGNHSRPGVCVYGTNVTLGTPVTP